jgi:hypothetical protein
MAALMRGAIFLLVLLTGIGLGFGGLSLLDRLDSPERPTNASAASSDPSTPASVPGSASQSDGAATASSPSGNQETPVFEVFTKHFAGWFVSTDCVKNPRLENGVAFGSDYLLHYTNHVIARFVTGGYHHISNDTIEFATDDDDSELYTIDHDTIFLSGIKINKIVIQFPAIDAATKSSLKMKICAPWNKGKPEEMLPAAPYSDIDGLRMAIQAGDGEAAIGFLAHGAFLPIRELEPLLTNSTIAEATKVNIKDQNHTNADAAATADKK